MFGPNPFGLGSRDRNILEGEPLELLTAFEKTRGRLEAVALMLPSHFTYTCVFREVMLERINSTKFSKVKLQKDCVLQLK